MIPDKYREDEELIRLTIAQLKKDFGTHFPELQFSGRKEVLFDELAEQLSETLQNIRVHNPAIFKAILYRVDVSEKQTAGLTDKKNCLALSEIIIQREFKKVLIKRFFRG